MEQASNVNIKVRNGGSVTSFMVAVFAINPANNSIKYVRLDVPIPHKDTQPISSSFHLTHHDIPNFQISSQIRF